MFLSFTFREEKETRTPTGCAHYPLKVARLPFRHLSIRIIYFYYDLVIISVIDYFRWLQSLLSDSNQRPRDYKSRALAN